MLIAINQYQQKLNLLEYDKKSIEKLKKDTWYCPVCKEELILKNGVVKISHFSHKKQSVCVSFSEGETEEHLKGKTLLAQWCQKFQIPFQLEAYLPQLKQRPDLLIDQRIAVEFQCSSLPLERMIERTKSYQENGYQVVWILGKKFFLNNRLTAMKRAFLNYSENIGYYYWQLDVVGKTLGLSYFIEELIGTKELLYGTKKWKFGEGNLVTIFDYPWKTKLFIKRAHDCETEVLGKVEALTRDLYHKKPSLLKIQELFYMESQNIRYLDICYFVPVNKPLFVQQDEILWKFYFWLFVEQQETLSIEWQDSIHYFQQLFLNKQLIPYSMPNVVNQHMIVQFLEEYVYALKTLGYLVYTEEKFEILQKPVNVLMTENHNEYLKKYSRKLTQISATPIRNVLS